MQNQNTGEFCSFAKLLLRVCFAPSQSYYRMFVPLLRKVINLNCAPRKGEESKIYLLTFDAEIFLIFGLSLIRCFCLQVSALLDRLARHYGSRYVITSRYVIMGHSFRVLNLPCSVPRCQLFASSPTSRPLPTSSEDSRGGSVFLAWRILAS